MSKTRVIRKNKAKGVDSQKLLRGTHENVIKISEIRVQDEQKKQ